MKKDQKHDLGSLGSTKIMPALAFDEFDRVLTMLQSGHLYLNCFAYQDKLEWFQFMWSPIPVGHDDALELNKRIEIYTDEHRYKN